MINKKIVTLDYESLFLYYFQGLYTVEQSNPGYVSSILLT